MPRWKRYLYEFSDGNVAKLFTKEMNANPKVNYAYASQGLPDGLDYGVVVSAAASTHNVITQTIQTDERYEGCKLNIIVL